MAEPLCEFCEHPAGQPTSRLVVSVAGHYRHQELPFLNICQEGVSGLVRAAETAWGSRCTPRRGSAGRLSTLLPCDMFRRSAILISAARSVTNPPAKSPA